MISLGLEGGASTPLEMGSKGLGQCKEKAAFQSYRWYKGTKNKTFFLKKNTW